jgi:hypothetical protein
VKWLAGAAGALGGAAACGTIVIVVWMAIDPPPKYDNWDVRSTRPSHATRSNGRAGNQ